MPANGRRDLIRRLKVKYAIQAVAVFRTERGNSRHGLVYRNGD